MRIVVCVKQVSMLGDEVEFDDESMVDPDFVDPALNEWDGYAVEQALRLKEASGNEADEVIVLSVGGADVEESMRRCLAMGADSGVRIDGLSTPDPLSIACALGNIISEIEPDLVICGAQSSDAAQSAVPSALAERLGMPAACMVVEFHHDPSARKAIAHRELEGGLIDVVEVELPAVISMQTGSTEPRYATLRQIKQAKKKPITEVDADLGGQPAGYRVRRMYVPPKTRNTIYFDGDVREVATKLKEVIEAAAK